jgi:hypothetical protein
VLATVRCPFAGIPEGATVTVVALAFAGTGRTLVIHEGRSVRVPNEAFIAVDIDI